MTDFWGFNAQTRNWTSLAEGPSVRYRHCMEWDQGRDQLILFGGISISGNFNDLWTYSIKSDRWQSVTETRAGASIPAERHSHACAFNTQLSTFHIQGGRQAHMLIQQDMWQFNFTSNNWTLLDTGNSNVERFSHSMRYSKSLNSHLLFFGRQQTNSYSNTIYQYSFNNPSAGWLLFQVSRSHMLSMRGYFSDGFNRQTGEYFVFGGYNTNNGETNLSTYLSCINCRYFLS